MRYPRTIFVLLTPLLCGQIRDPTRINLESILKTVPPSSGLKQKFKALPPRTQSLPDGPIFFSRVFLDPVTHSYFGYELFVEQPQPGTYRATFGKLGVSQLDLAGEGKITTLDWVLLALPEIPQPRLIHAGDTLSIDVFIDNSTGEKLVDEISVIPRVTKTIFIPSPIMALRAPVTVIGPARDFSPGDAELQLDLRAITLNGFRERSNWHPVRGTLVWVYIPDHGRFILSLSPRPGLDFKPTGEIRGAAVTFTVGDDTVSLECVSPIAGTDSAYNLYRPAR